MITIAMINKICQSVDSSSALLTTKVISTVSKSCSSPAFETLIVIVYVPSGMSSNFSSYNPLDSSSNSPSFNFHSYSTLAPLILTLLSRSSISTVRVRLSPGLISILSSLTSSTVTSVLIFLTAILKSST